LPGQAGKIVEAVPKYLVDRCIWPGVLPPA